MEKSPKNNSFASTLKQALLWAYGSYILYFIVMANPTVYRYYLRYYRSTSDVMPIDAPTQIHDAKEVYDVHTYEDMLPYAKDQVVVFRNFTNCAEKFENVIYPRHEDHVDDVERIEMLENPGNIYISGFKRLRKTFQKTLKEILEEKASNYFPAFLQFFDNEDMKYMLNIKDDERFSGESTLISHFDRDVVTTTIHGDQWVQSYGLQCYGTRSFIFHSLQDLAKYGLNPAAMIHGIIVSGSPSSINKIPTTRAVINPGDVVYFSPMYYHSVAAKKGKNVLFSIRRTSKESLWMSYKKGPTLFLTAVYRIIYRNIFHKKHKGGFFISQDYMPYFDEYRDEIYNYRVEAGFGTYNGLADFGLPNDA